MSNLDIPAIDEPKFAKTPQRTRKTTIDAMYREASKASVVKAFRPMLSATCEDITTLKYPVLVSPKLDGIRCLIRDGVAVSRNLKPIPNDFVQSKLKGLPDGLDGELIVGKPTGDDVWNRSSAVMKKSGEPDFTYHVFDCLSPGGRSDEAFSVRLEFADYVTENFSACVEIVTHRTALDAHDLAVFENYFVGEGYEGVMIRSINGAYKFGRSTVKEGGLLKLKRWHDAEAIVVDMVERQHNGNEGVVDLLGRTKRSSKKANKTGRGDMGTLVCTMPAKPGEEQKVVIDTFEVGTGFTDAQRAEFWNNRAKYERRLVTFKYQSLSPEGIPRFPVFKGFRHVGDMSA
jgi:DNA ligase-1